MEFFAEKTLEIAHVVEIRSHLEKMGELAKSVERTQQKQKAVYDRRAKPVSLEVGDDVLVLLPTQWNQLKLESADPYTVNWKVTSVDYEVETPGQH